MINDLYRNIFYEFNYKMIEISEDEIKKKAMCIERKNYMYKNIVQN